MPRFLIHKPTGSAYHSLGMSEVCAHALDQDGSFSTECEYDAAIVDEPHELPKEVRKWIDKVRGHKSV